MSDATDAAAAVYRADGQPQTVIPEPVDNGKRILVRATRLGEQFNDNDKFIAWYVGDAAGTMAETPEAAIEKLRSFQEQEADQKFVEPSTRLLNEAGIKKHALDCSKRFRAGKFTRVGQDFIDEVQADVEAMVRELRARNKTLNDPIVITSGLTTGLLCDKVREALNGAIGRLIQNKVQRQPTVGKTLGRTR